MDQHLKQRIVGAIVLVSVAVIFIPMLFEEHAELGELSISETNIPKFPAEEFEEKRRPLPIKEEIEELVKLPAMLAPSLEPASTKKLAKKKVIKRSQATLKIAPSYIIQVGSFGNKSNAEKLARKIKKSGFPTFVKSSSENKKLMYRVVVGPELDRKRTEQNKAKIEKLFNLKAIILKQQK
jgi:DedD protein